MQLDLFIASSPFQTPGYPVTPPWPSPPGSNRHCHPAQHETPSTHSSPQPLQLTPGSSHNSHSPSSCSIASYISNSSSDSSSSVAPPTWSLSTPPAPPPGLLLLLPLLWLLLHSPQPSPRSGSYDLPGFPCFSYTSSSSSFPLHPSSSLPDSPSSRMSLSPSPSSPVTECLLLPLTGRFMSQPSVSALRTPWPFNTFPQVPFLLLLLLLPPLAPVAPALFTFLSYSHNYYPPAMFGIFWLNSFFSPLVVLSSHSFISAPLP